MYLLKGHNCFMIVSEDLSDHVVVNIHNPQEIHEGEKDDLEAYRLILRNLEKDLEARDR
jgi:hypothetical protein